jgi:hypothetical protein
VKLTAGGVQLAGPVRKVASVRVDLSTLFEVRS